MEREGSEGWNYKGRRRRLNSGKCCNIVVNDPADGAGGHVVTTPIIRY